MFKKIISILLIFSLLINSAFAEPFTFYSESKEPVENVFTFKPAIIPEDFSGLKFDLAYFPLDSLPNNLPENFQITGQGLFCLNVNEYDNMLAIVKTNKFNLDSVVKLERKQCQAKKDNISKKCEKREDELLGKISKIEKDLNAANVKYKSLENKVLWIQVGAGIAILSISGFAIYSMQK
tara:strand:+ start:1204 stop:1743 length:540 start_codon:yes stop_codon:yes gene_type:complete